MPTFWKHLYTGVILQISTLRIVDMTEKKPEQ
ncbi:unnamed protein product, partial [Allacma fusca]